MRAFVDPWVVGPLVLAALVFAMREATRGAVPPPVEPHPAVALPLPRADAAPRRDQEYELDAGASVVRFVDGGGAGDRVIECPAIRGRLELALDRDVSHLELDLDLGSLRAVDGALAVDDAELWQLFGVRPSDNVSYRAGLLTSTTTPVPALRLLQWRGELRFGGRTVRQDLELWQTALPGQALRLQGHGAVPGDAYGLGPRGPFAFLHDAHVVTLGFDLAWKRIVNR